MEQAILEALDACIDNDKQSGFESDKTQKQFRRERTLEAKRILKFLENCPEDASVMELRQALETVNTPGVEQ